MISVLEKQFQDNCTEDKRSKNDVQISPETRGRVAHVAMATLEVGEPRKRPSPVAPAPNDARFFEQAVLSVAAAGRVLQRSGTFPHSHVTFARFLRAFGAFQGETRAGKKP